MLRLAGGRLPQLLRSVRGLPPACSRACAAPSPAPSSGAWTQGSARSQGPPPGAHTTPCPGSAPSSGAWAQGSAHSQGPPPTCPLDSAYSLGLPTGSQPSCHPVPPASPPSPPTASTPGPAPVYPPGLIPPHFCPPGPLASCTQSPPPVCTPGPPAACSPGPSASCTQSPPPACTLGPPAACSPGPSASCTQRPPPACPPGPPAACSPGPPASCTQSHPPACPPASCTQSPPPACPTGPPASCTQSPPPACPPGPPASCTQNPPPACPPASCTQSPPPACPPVSCTQNPPPACPPHSCPPGPPPGTPMERAVVRCVPSEPQLTLSFVLEGSHRHMQREQTEPLGRALARIATNAAKAAQGGKAKKCKRSAGPASPPDVRLYYQEKPLPDDLPNAEAWCQDAVLQVGEARYTVQRNPPTFLAAQLPRHIMAGFPVCPAPLRIEFGQLQASLFCWFREAAGEPGGWTAAGQQRVYTPANTDIGLRLKLHCTPGSQEGESPARYGEPLELESSCKVEAGPGVCAFEQRHLYTQRASGEDSLRIVSYNLLADVYAQTEHSRTVLYPYCAPYALEADYRQTLLRKELSGYNGDLLCLQEVDSSVFSDSLGPALDAFGLQGLFRLKEKQHEGLATFYRPDKLSLLSQHDISLSQALLAEPLHAELLEKLSAYEPAKEKLVQRSSQLQVSVFQSTHDPSRKICVANTHLYFHPKGGNIRLLQSAIALTHIKHVASELYPGIPIIFCGDFNSIPSSGLYSFFISGTVSEHHEDWVSNGEEERCNMSLAHSFKMKSACGEPAYTNYVGGFHGCLDYIFIDSGVLEVEQVIPMPSHEEVTTHQALPSVSHPSDHIALVCDLKWK